MTAWASVLGPGAVVLVLVLLPGLALGLALRLRGLLLLGTAAPLSVAVWGISAVVAGQVGVAWSWTVPAATTALLGALLAVVTGLGSGDRPSSGTVLAARSVGSVGSRGTRGSAAGSAGSAAGTTGAGPELVRDRARLRSTGAVPTVPAGGRSGPRTPWGLLGAAAGAVLVAGGLCRAIVSPTLVSQSADVLFHLNAVRYVLRTGDASSVHLGRVSSPDAVTAFYPGTWHGLAAAAVQLTGVSIPVATNLVALVFAAVVWPLAVVALADRLLPRTPAGTGGLVAAGALAGCVPGFPWLSISWGVLYPTLLAVAVLPGVVALVVAIAQRLEPVWSAAGGAGGLAALLLVLPVLVAGLGLGHPSAVAALAVVAGPLVVATLLRMARAGWRAPGGRPVVLVCAAVGVGVAALGVVLVGRADLLSAVLAYRWPDDIPLTQAAGQALLLTAPRSHPALLLAALAVAGALECLRRRRHRWLVVAWAASALLYVVAETTPANLLTGAWYNDSNRLAILLAVPAVPLAALGAAWAGDAAGGWVRSVLPARSPGVPTAAGGVAAVGVPVALALVVAVGPVSGMPSARGAVRDAFPAVAAPEQIISADELALYERLADEVPPDAVIADDPFQGTSIVLAVADRTPLFAHLTGRLDDDDLLIASSLDRVGTDPAVCAAVRAKKVEYLLDTGPRTYDFLPKAVLFEGIVRASGSGAFTLVDAEGDAKLYRLTQCAGG